LIRMKAALVTGATGFVGRVLCGKLKARGVQNCALARNPENGPWDRIVVADVGAGPLPDGALEGVDTVFHLAGKVHALSELEGAESEYVRANVDGTRNVLEAAVKAKVPRFVFISSVKAGGEGSDVCLDEAMEDNPETPYGRTKLEAERLVFKFAREHEMHAVVLRLPLVYGPGHKGNLDRMLQAVAARRFTPLPEFGNQRSMVHVDDVAEAAILAAESPEANVQTYIVTDGRPYSTRELYSLIRLALGRRKPRLSIPLKVLRTAARFGDAMGRLRGRRFFFDSDALEKLASSAWYSSRKIETELGFKPAYDLEKALPEMIAELRGGRRETPNPAPTS
jgi:UDP-glucose 4-epimerase